MTLTVALYRHAGRIAPFGFMTPVRVFGRPVQVGWPFRPLPVSTLNRLADGACGYGLVWIAS